MFLHQKSAPTGARKKENPDNRGAAPSLLRILVNLRHTARTFDRFLNIDGQSLSASEITRPKYLKEVTISRGRPYALTDLDVTGLSSSAARRSCFCSAPFLHCAVHPCIPLKYRNGTIISHRRHRGWGRLPSSSITTLSRAGWCQKCTYMVIHAAARPLHPFRAYGC